MMSSGQLVTTHPDMGECEYTDCEFAGPVDLVMDPETGWAGWTCPVCEWQNDKTGWFE